jgi:hypothetical protein
VWFAHLFSGSAIIDEVLGSYCRHGSNNFCSNSLLSADVSVGDMRFHPNDQQFSLLVLKVLALRHEKFLGLLGAHRYSSLCRHFQHAAHKTRKSSPRAFFSRLQHIG